MTQTSILITGATGNIGSALIPLLKNEPLNLWAGSTQGQMIDGVAGCAIDFLSLDNLHRAFDGIDTAFIVIPAHPRMLEMADNIAQAAKSSAVQHLVRVSGAGADHTSNIAIAKAQGQVDRTLVESGIASTFLRPKNFMQNFSGFLAGMIKSGTFYTSQGEGKVPFIDVRDIAEVAAQILKNPAAHAGQAYTLTGSEALSNQEAIHLISQATQRPIELVQVPETAAVQSMRDMGMPDFVVKLMSSLNQIIAAGYVAEVTDTVAQILGKPARRFEDFAQEYASSWQV